MRKFSADVFPFVSPVVASQLRRCQSKWRSVGKYPPYSKHASEELLGWLRTSGKSVKEKDIALFVLAWQLGDVERMHSLADVLSPFAPQPMHLGVITGADFCSAAHPPFALLEMKALHNTELAGLVQFAEALYPLVEVKMTLMETKSCVDDQSPVPILQNTFALVVKNCSGVGKTVASLGVAVHFNSKSPDWYFYPLYTGFDTGFGLTEGEKEFLKGQGALNFEGRVRSVLLRRLYLQLGALVAATEGGVFLQRATLPEGTILWCPKMPLPIKADEFGPSKEDEFGMYATFPEDDYVAFKACVDMVAALGKRCEGGKRLALILIVDEGQLFDELSVCLGGKRNGARFVLRLLRELQLAVSKVTRDAFVIPLMTGINPEMSLDHSSCGNNIEVGNTILNETEFEDVVRIASPNADRQRETAAILYPLAREVGNALREPSMPITTEISSDHAPLALIATAAEVRIPVPLWHTTIPVRKFEYDCFVPRIPLILFDAYLQKCPWLRKFGLRVPNTLSELLESMDHSHFERNAFLVLRIVLAVVNTPPPDGSLISSVHREYASCQGGLKFRLPWFDLRAPSGRQCALDYRYTFPSTEEDRAAQQAVHLPSSAHGSHKDAFAIDTNGTAVHALNSSIEGLLRDCCEVGSTVAIHAGGSAPVAFIFLTCVDTGEVSGVKGFVLRLAHAKCTAVDEGHLPKLVIDAKSPPAFTMLEKFDMVAVYLTATLDQAKMKVVATQYAIVTNATEVTFQDGHRDRIHVLSPVTFKFAPLTSLLFGVALGI